MLALIIIALAALLLSNYLQGEIKEIPPCSLSLEECSGTLTILYDNNPYDDRCMTD
jgi:hypothetical protein